MVRSPWDRRVLGGLAVLACGAACGLRSELVPFDTEGAADDATIGDDADGDGGGDAGTIDLGVDPERRGSCSDPIPMPFANTTVTGSLPASGSLTEGWCGGDGGPEDVYRLLAEFSTDITIVMDPAMTEFEPVLRVQAGGCDTGAGDTIVCDGEILAQPFHFYALGGVEYFIAIDSAEGSSGPYAFSTIFGWPTLDQCPIHPEVIKQVPGATFIWQNSFSRGQGRVDGACGGPGRENMFRIDAVSAGPIYARVEGTGGFQPVISLRTSCAALSELSCVVDGATGLPGIAELSAVLPDAGEFYLVVDQVGYEGGDYSLLVQF